MAYVPFAPASLAEIRKHIPRGPLHEYLAKFAWQDKVLFLDDFLGDAINLDMYAVANSSGTSAADFAHNLQRNGAIQSDTGTTDDGSVSIIGAINWYGDYNAGIEVRIKTDVVTDVNLEVGFIDAVPAANAGGVTDEDTPTTAFADGALMSVDTDETFKKLGFYTKGSTAGQGVKRTSLGPVPSLTGTTDALPVADTYFTVAVQLVGNSAYLFVNNKLMASHDDDPQGNLEGGVALAPWIYTRTRSTTAVFTSIDYIAMWADRS